MADSFVKLDGIGDLRELPQELRLDFYEHLLPGDFLQIYRANESGYTRARAQQSLSFPLFLCVSKELQNEMLSLLMSNRTCEARIDGDTIKKSFIMHDIWRTAAVQQLIPAQKVPLRIPVCKRLTMTIVLPSPRMPEDFAQVRQTVIMLVDLINTTAGAAIPQICLQLEDQDPGESKCAPIYDNNLDIYWSYSMNAVFSSTDFKMLMGPFARLQKPSKAVMAYRTMRGSCFNAGADDYCARIEEAIKGSMETKQGLLFEQLTIDILVPLGLYQALETLEKQVDPSRGAKILGLRMSSKLRSAVCALEDWYNADDADKNKQAAWLNRLKVALADEAFPRKCDWGFWNEILSGREPRYMLYWVAGVMTGNLFW